MTTFPLWIRAQTPEDAARQGQAWADAEPAWSFLRVVSVVPHATFYLVFIVTVECEPMGLTLGLVS